MEGAGVGLQCLVAAPFYAAEKGIKFVAKKIQNVYHSKSQAKKSEVNVSFVENENKNKIPTKSTLEKLSTFFGKKPNNPVNYKYIQSF